MKGSLTWHGLLANLEMEPVPSNDNRFSDSMPTLPTADILSGKNVRAWVSMNFTQDKYSAPRTIEKMKILGALLELPAK